MARGRKELLAEQHDPEKLSQQPARRDTMMMFCYLATGRH